MFCYKFWYFLVLKQSIIIQDLHISRIMSGLVIPRAGLWRPAFSNQESFKLHSLGIASRYFTVYVQAAVPKTNVHKWVFWYNTYFSWHWIDLVSIYYFLYNLKVRGAIQIPANTNTGKILYLKCIICL